MPLIKFNNDSRRYYNCTECFYNNNLATIKNIESYPKNIEGGFSVFEYIDEEKTKVRFLKDLSEYNLLWEKNENDLIFSNDNKIYKTYFIYNEDNFIFDEITTSEDFEQDNILLIDEGIGREHQEFLHIELFDEDDFYLYKVIDGEKVNTTKEDKDIWKKNKEIEEFINIKENKMQEISNICKEKIISGVDVNNSHYNYTIEDQTNIYNSMNLAIQTNLDIPYHAEGESCRLFTKEELIEIYIANEMNVASQITYNNQIKQYINTLTIAEEIESITYGTPLTGQYLETYNAMMTQAEKIIRHITNINK